MAIGAIEMSTIARSQDLIRYKTDEDTRGAIQQANLVVEKEKEVRSNASKVCHAEESGWHSQRFDASAEGKGTYSGDGGRNRKKKPGGDKKVFRESGHFDMQI